MLMQPTLNRLRQMSLHGMAEALARQLESPQPEAWSFEERLGLLVDHEYSYRENRRMARRLKEARLRLNACPEDVDYRHPRGLDRSLFRYMLGGQWIRSGQHLLITGPTGVGKSFLACALAHAACREGYSARYWRLSRLLSELMLAKADGSQPQRLARLAKTDLLVLDDWGLAPLSPGEARELLEVIDDRSQGRSTLVASQLPVEHWHQVIEDATVADAIVDRLMHNAHRIALKGDSLRRRAQPVTTHAPPGSEEGRTGEGTPPAPGGFGT